MPRPAVCRYPRGGSTFRPYPTHSSMVLPKGENPVAVAIAEAIVDGFDKHYRLFREAEPRGEGALRARRLGRAAARRRDRIAVYDQRVREGVGAPARSTSRPKSGREHSGRRSSSLYIGLLYEHKQPECAETFFNSVACRVLDRTLLPQRVHLLPPGGVDRAPRGRAARPTADYYPLRHGWHGRFGAIFADFELAQPVRRPATRHRLRARCARVRRFRRTAAARAELPDPGARVARSSATRRPTSCGRSINGDREYPFVVPVLHDATGASTSTRCSSDPLDIGRVFSLARAYFMVDMEVPSAYVEFLRTADAHQAARRALHDGRARQAGQDALLPRPHHHLRHSDDAFIIAPGHARAW